MVGSSPLVKRVVDALFGVFHRLQRLIAEKTSPLSEASKIWFKPVGVISVKTLFCG